MGAPYLLVLAHARSGSTYLVDLMGSFKRVGILAEFFHRNQTQQNSPFRDRALVPFNGSDDALVDTAMTDPLATLAFRDGIDDIDLYVVKILGHQLRSNAARKILIDNAAGVVILRRNAFASWTSRALVKQSRAWTNANTVAKTVEFNRQSFINTAHRYTGQIAEFTRLVAEAGVPSITLSYSELIAIESPAALLSRMTAAFPGFPALEPNPEWTQRIVRQDTRKPIDRVSNRDEAIAQLTEIGLDYLLDDRDYDDIDTLRDITRPLRTAPKGAPTSTMWESIRRSLRRSS